MENSKPEIRSIRISADQKSILKKTFEKFPSPNHSTEALDLLSLKTGLRSELIKKWFHKRRLALVKKNDDDEIQILDDNSATNEELENYDEDYIDLDNDDSLETSSTTGAVSSTSSGVELSLESKAAEYNLLKQQMEVLQGQLSQMTQNLDLTPENPPPPPVSDYYYPSQGYHFHPQQQYPYQYQYQQQPLPYPPYNNYFYPGYSQGQLYNSNQSYWALPYPPPDFQLVIPDPPTFSREDSSGPAAAVEKQELEDFVEPGGAQLTEDEAAEDLVKDEEPRNKEDGEGYFKKKEIPIETQANEASSETLEPIENIATLETSKNPESETYSADQTTESEITKDLENVQVTPESPETEEKVDNIAAIPQTDSMAEITDSTTEAILERYKNIGECPQKAEAGPQQKYPPTPFKKNESLENLEEEDNESELNEDDLKTFEHDTSVLTEENDLDLSLLITSPEVSGEETLDENLPPRNISDQNSEKESNLSNVSFLEALVEVPRKSETPEVVPVDDKKPAPKPFIVKEEPTEVKQMKLGRKSLPTKSKSRVFVPVATFDEMDSEETVEKQKLSELSALPPVRTKQFYRGQNINKTLNPSVVEPQKTLQQNSKQKPKAKLKEPANQFLRISQQKPAPQIKSSPAPPRPQQSQPARGNKRAQTDKSQSRAKMARQKPPPAPRIPKINNYTTITVTKVVEPPTIPPSKRPELQRILKMSNLSVSIKR